MCRRGAAAVGVLVLGLIVGCNGPSAPTPTPNPVLPSTARADSPEIPSPRDLGDLATMPCAMALTTSELRSMGFQQPGQQRELLIGAQECSWIEGDETLALSVVTERDYFGDTYRTRLQPIFVPTRVEGMPAVRQRFATDDNRCVVTTGLAAMQTIEVTWSGLTMRQTVDPCEIAEEASAMIIRKLPPA